MYHSCETMKYHATVFQKYQILFIDFNHNFFKCITILYVINIPNSGAICVLLKISYLSNTIDNRENIRKN